MFAGLVVGLRRRTVGIVVELGHTSDVRLLAGGGPDIRVVGMAARAARGDVLE